MFHGGFPGGFDSGSGFRTLRWRLRRPGVRGGFGGPGLAGQGSVAGRAVVAASAGLWREGQVCSAATAASVA